MDLSCTGGYPSGCIPEYKCKENKQDPLECICEKKGEDKIITVRKTKCSTALSIGATMILFVSVPLTVLFFFGIIYSILEFFLE